MSYRSSSPGYFEDHLLASSSRRQQRPPFFRRNNIVLFSLFSLVIIAVVFNTRISSSPSSVSASPADDSAGHYHFSSDEELHEEENDQMPTSSSPSSSSSSTSSLGKEREKEAWAHHALHPNQHLLNDHPTDSWWQNLRPDSKYITAWSDSGWTNDVISVANLIYLARITDRIPIIPKFVPSHVKTTYQLPFSEVFDTERLSRSLGIPILEWSQVKDVNSSTVDDIGCWTIWKTVKEEDNRVRFSYTPETILADISYTRVPSWMNMGQNHVSFWSLAKLAYPKGRADAMAANAAEPSEAHGLELAPNEQLLCFDYLYYVSIDQHYEIYYDYSPAWKDSLAYFRWSSRLEKIADDHIRVALGISDASTPTPKYVVVHARRMDFKQHCHGPLEQCFPSVATYARRVREVQEELELKLGESVTTVFMTSDEKDAEWWAEVDALGWHHIDFEQQLTVERYGQWYPVLIDAVIQSGGWGFVGTQISTMSLVAQRRMESWRGEDNVASRTVQWGTGITDA